ncbi:MAG: dynamin family protein [Defluviitaleaceae bacterium]|nr:dynamin family protein [Defluviitaleaceae bacterium]
MSNEYNRLVDCFTQLCDIKMSGFATSLDFCDHPLLKRRLKTRLVYFASLEYLTKSCAVDKEYTEARLSQYRALLIGDNAPLPLTPDAFGAAIKTITGDFLKPWKRGYCSMLLCDTALILMDIAPTSKAFDIVAEYLNERKQKRLNKLCVLLFSNAEIPPLFADAERFITQFRINHNFTSQSVMRVMVTANMSAGKSTLINALIGKPIMRTSQEACTANLCYIYNKPFEDNRLHLIASQLNLDVTHNDLLGVGRETVSSVASFFRATGHPQKRICLIDTPGVNSALNSNHGKVARKAIAEEKYDKLIYVINATLLGTDDEIKYLKYIFENVPNEKVIFVLNKLDCFKSIDDSISASINGVKADLENIGFKNPIICPMSAYFSLLLKMKQGNENLSEDEQDVLDLYIKKFNKPEYDLSIYYHETLADKKPNHDELVKMSFISGLFGLENILYGGISA